MSGWHLTRSATWSLSFRLRDADIEWILLQDANNRNKDTINMNENMTVTKPQAETRFRRFRRMAIKSFGDRDMVGSLDIG
jgi:hypothetical protein